MGRARTKVSPTVLKPRRKAEGGQPSFAYGLVNPRREDRLNVFVVGINRFTPLPSLCYNARNERGAPVAVGGKTSRNTLR